MKIDYEWKLEYIDTTENIVENEFEDEGKLNTLINNVGSTIVSLRERHHDITKVDLCLVRHTRGNNEDYWEDHDEAYIVEGKISEDRFKVPKRLKKEFEKYEGRLWWALWLLFPYKHQLKGTTHWLPTKRGGWQ